MENEETIPEAPTESDPRINALYLLKLQAERAWLEALRLVYEPRFMEETATYVVDRDDAFHDEFFGDEAVQTRKDAVLHHQLMRATYPSAVAESLTNAYYADAMHWLHAAAAYLKTRGTLLNGEWAASVSADEFAAARQIDDIEALKAYNLRIMGSLWYRWFFFDAGIMTGQRVLRRLLVSPDVLAQRQAERTDEKRLDVLASQRKKDNAAKYNAIKEECEREIKAADESMAHVPPSSDPMAYSQASKRATDIYVAAMKRSSSAFYELILGRAPPPLEMPSN